MATGDGRGPVELWVQEIFYTIQGEGPFAGEPAVFVRLADCNLRCYWCDTDFRSARHPCSIEDVVAEAEACRPPFCRLAVITGGEPLRQEIAPVVRRLLERGLRVQIETSGSRWVELPADDRVTVVCSPKTTRLHPRVIERVSAFKYVIAEGEIDPADGLPSTSTQARGRPCRIARPSGPARIYVMPRDDGDPARNQANARACAAVALRFGYLVTMQTHKLLGVR